MTGPGSEGLQAETAVQALCERCGSVAGDPPVCCSSHNKVLCHQCYRLTHFVEVCDCPKCATEQSPVVPSAAAAPVEVPEDDCWFGDDPNTVGTAAAQNRVWCVQCADWTDQAVAHDIDHRRVAEGDLAGFAARVRAEERQRAASELQQFFKDYRGVDWGDVIELSRRIMAAGSAVPVATPTEPVVIERAGWYVVTFPTGDTSTYYDATQSYLFQPGVVWQHQRNADALEAIVKHRARTAAAAQDDQQ